MATEVIPFNDEQARILVNLATQYSAWIEVERQFASLPYNLIKKTVGEYVYLYEVIDRRNNAKSLGPWDDEAQQKLEDYQALKSELKERRATIDATLAQTSGLYRQLRLPLLDSRAGEVLRECDARALLRDKLIVVGTNAMVAYELEANGTIRDVPMETADFDLAWSAEKPVGEGEPIWDMLKAVDSTYTVNTERPFQARNAKAYEVEILAAPSRRPTMARRDKPTPVDLPEQEWLLLGRFVDQVVVTRDLKPARIVAPDPRYYALHKLWMSQKPRRNPQKKPKDRKQGLALLDAVHAAMPHYPLDADFIAALPAELLPHFHEWRDASSR